MKRKIALFTISLLFGLLLMASSGLQCNKETSNASDHRNDSANPHHTLDQCADGMDNDFDRRIDFGLPKGCYDWDLLDDSECTISPPDPSCLNGCLVFYGLHTTEGLDWMFCEYNMCNDLIDNDLDGLTDWNDPDCAYGNVDGLMPMSWQYTEYAQCNDEADNDGDTYIDFGNDPEDESWDRGCEGSYDYYETGDQTGAECYDGFDNDGDTFIDEADASCINTTMATELAACEDEVDNDGDGFIDFVIGSETSDPGCLFLYDDDEFNDPLTECDDGVDNDGDTFIDEGDPGCSDPTMTGEVAQCQDGFDNDSDGLIDFGTAAGNDPECASANDTEN